MPVTRKLSALVVEDHEMVSEMLAAHLTGAGFTVVGVADTAAKAHALFVRRQPDLILCDIQLEGPANGIAFTRRVVTERPGTLVVMISAEYDNRLVTAAYEAGAVGYVSKRASGPEMLRAVADAVAGSTEVADRHTYRRMIEALKDPRPDIRALLTPREQEVIELLASGVTTTVALAQAMQIQGASVRTHVASALRKLGAHSRAEAVAVAYREGLIRQERA